MATNSFSLTTIPKIASRIYELSDIVAIPRKGDSETTLRLNITTGKTEFNNVIFNYFWYNTIVTLNSYPTHFFDPDSSSYVLGPLVSFPEHNKTKYFSAQVPPKDMDLNDVIKTLRLKKVFIVNGSYVPTSGISVVQSTQYADCFVGDFTYWGYAMTKHDVIHSTGNIKTNTLNILQHDTVTYGMFKMFKHVTNKSVYIIKTGCLITIAGLDLLYLLSRVFRSVRIVKSIHSSWLIDTFIIICCNPTPACKSIGDITGTGSIYRIFDEPIDNDTFTGMLFPYLIRIYDTIWMMNSSLLHMLNHPSKEAKNVIYLEFLSYTRDITTNNDNTANNDDTVSIKQSNSKRVVKPRNYKKIVPTIKEKKWTIYNDHAVSKRVDDDNTELYITLNDLHITRKWTRGFKLPKIEMGGQIKLLLGEIQLFTQYANILPLRKSSEDEVIVLYIGSAPGIHLTILIELLVNYKLQWHLYDTVDHAKQLYDLPNVRIYNALFTKKDIKNYKDKKVILISDIRSAGAFEPTTEDIVRDTKLQFDIVLGISPIISSLKYRLPFMEDISQLDKIPITDYNPLVMPNIEENIKSDYYVYLIPDGIMNLQSFHLADSTEFRILIRGIPELLGVTANTLNMVEELMFYYNTMIRFTPRISFKAKLTEMGYDWCCCHNCCMLYTILDRAYEELDLVYNDSYEFFNSIISKIGELPRLFIE